MNKLIKTLAFLSALPIHALALDSFSYSGRLVNNNGSPVAGPVDLRFDISSTADPSDVLCSKSVTGVPLSQGVFHVKLKFDPADCEGNAFQNLMEAVPANQNLTYQVTDVTNSRTYSVQNMYAVPSSFMANFAKNLPQMGALPNQVLKWDDALKRWVPGSAGSGDGSVKTINTDSSLTGGPITDSGTLAVAIGGITNVHLAGGIDPAKLAGTRDGTNYLKGDNSWGTFASDVLNTVLTGLSTASSSVVTVTDSILAAIGKLQGQVSDLEDTKLSKTGGTLSVGTINGVPVPLFDDQVANKKYVDDQLGGVNSSQWLDATPHIYFNTGNVGVGTGTPNDKLDVVGNIALTGRLRLKDSGSNFVELRAPLTTAGVTFVLPATAGTTGQVLKTDGTGNLSWGNSSVGSADIADGSIVDADVAAGAAIAQSKIAGLTTDLAGKEPTIVAGTTAQYWRGDKTWQTLNTDIVPEGATNKYYSNTLARGAISVTSPISYNSGTGVIGMVSGTSGDLLRFNGSSWVPWAPTYLSAEADTLATVTGRGSTTSTPVVLLGGANFPGTGIWNSSGSVGIGTNTPRSKLDVVGGVQIGADADICNSTKAGTIRYNASNVEYCNGTIWAAFGVSGSGITNFNGSTVGSQSLAVPGTTGTAPNWVTVPATGIHTLHIPMASGAGVTAGLISKVDYDAFTAVASGVLPVSRGGTNTSSLVGNRIMVSTPAAIVEAPALTNGQLLIGATGATPVVATLTAGTGVTITNSSGGITINATGSGGTVTNVTGTAPINVATGSTTPVISLSQATTSTPGYLSSTDWNTFNNKQNSLASGATINGVTYPASGAQTLQVSNLPVNATDVVNKLYVDSFGQWGTSAGNVYRTSGNVGIGTSTPTTALEVVGQVKITGGTPGVGKILTSDASGLATWQTPSSGADNLGNHTATQNIILGSNWLSGDGGNEGVRIDSTGNVGIGATTPSSKLEVAGGLRVGNGSLAVPSISFSNKANTGLYLNSGEQVGVVAGGNLAAAFTPLDTYFYLPVYLPNGTASSYAIGSTSGGGLFFPNVNTVAVSTNNLERLRVDQNGNVGIGTTAPGTKLEVAGQVKITGGSPGAGKVLTSDGSGLASWTTIGGGTVTNVTGTLPISVASGTTTPVVSISQANTTTNGYLSFTDWNTFNNKQAPLSAGGTINGVTYPASGVQNLKVTNAPVSATDVVNFQALNSAIGAFWTSGSTHIWNANSGNVGVGMINPLYKLDVQGGTSYYSTMIRGQQTNARLGIQNDLAGANGQTAEIEFRLNGNDRGGISMHTTNSTSDLYDLLFYSKTAGVRTERMRIANNGNVGIGTSSPGAQLEVAGQVKITGGTPGAGKVLTSDGAGLATWMTPSGTGDFMKDGSVAMTGQLRGVVGATIAYSFNGDTNTGMQSTGGDNLSFVTGGITAATFNSTQQLYLFNNGSALFPSITFAGNSTGIWSSGANILNFSTNGLERLQINSSGNVGIGTSSPSSKLTVNGTVASVAVNDTTPTSFDMSLGNYQYTSTGCSGGFWALNNMVEGASYTIAVQNNTHTGNCNFIDGSSTFKYKPANATPASGHVIYSFVKYGSFVYVSWIEGF